ncbi:MAG: type II toxin-antitoxin system VapC family toxin [Candidatus Korobacteraceae bacterium]
MKVLLDTHVFLWAATGDRRLSSRALGVLADKQNTFIVSVASVWEILVKAASGKLDIPAPAGAYVQSLLGRAPAAVLPILMSHVLRIESLPPHHRDPFDRILAAQAVEEGIPIVTADQGLRGYPIEVVW